MLRATDQLSRRLSGRNFIRGKWVHRTDTHSLPGRTDSPPDSELVPNAVKEGAGVLSDGGGYRTLIPNP